MNLPRIIAIGGPTAAGKTAAALALAEALGGEIVNADSVQIYRGFDIGSAKPTPEERARAPHHLIDVCEASEVYSAAKFAAAADEAIADIAARGRVPILAGGTGLYIRAVLDGLFDARSDPALRHTLRERCAEQGAPALHARLSEVDPAAAARISENDGVRIVRALEVFELAGRPISELQAEHARMPARYPCLRVTVTRRRSELDARIRTRIGAMLEAGLVDEVRGLRAAGVPDAAPPMTTVGYRQVVEMLAGALPDDELAERIRIATRRFSKRQLTWFRGQWRSRWLDLADPTATQVLRDGARSFLAEGPPATFGLDDDATLRDA